MRRASIPPWRPTVEKRAGNFNHAQEMNVATPLKSFHCTSTATGLTNGREDLDCEVYNRPQPGSMLFERRRIFLPFPSPWNKRGARTVCSNAPVIGLFRIATGHG